MKKALLPIAAAVLAAIIAVFIITRSPRPGDTPAENTAPIAATEPTEPSEPAEPTEPTPPPPTTASDLQLALFAHMAFFPHNFHTTLPASPAHNPFHYQPFIADIIHGDTLDFSYLMEDWEFGQTYTDPDTGFSATIFTAARGDAAVLAIRGSYGDMLGAITHQQGTWWCNFTALSGATHSHLGGLTAFLDMPGIRGIFEDVAVYITGHSLGGYLAYMAAYQLQDLDIQRVAAFSAPIFNAHTIETIGNLPPTLRERFIHYYVAGDLIAGIVGASGDTPPPPENSLEILLHIFQNLENHRGVYVPQHFYALLDPVIAMGRFLPVALPEYLVDILWQINTALGEEPLEMMAAFAQLITHVTVPQTWFTPRPDPTWDENTSILALLRDHGAEAMMVVLGDMIQVIFDGDAHFMMNFYPYLASEADGGAY